MSAQRFLLLFLAALGGCSNGSDEPPPSHQHQVDPPYNQAPNATVTAVCTIAHLGDEIVFDGTASIDPDGDALSYRWELVAGPVSDVTLIGATTPTPTFIPTVPGNYSFRLTVNDGRVDSSSGAGDVKSVTVYSMQPVTTAKKVATGHFHFVVLMDDQSVHGWGCNHSGQAGSGAVVTGAVDVAAGANFSLALMPDGTVEGWGTNGVAGFPRDSLESCGTLPCSRTPVVVNGLSNIVQLAGGLGIVNALDADGTVWWPRPGTSDPVPVVTGAHSTGIDFAALDDGTIWTPQPLELSQPLPGIVKVSSVESTSRLVLKDDGTVYSIGLYGAVVEKLGLPNIVDIAAGSYVQLALDDQGTVWDVEGIVVKPVLNDVVNIAAGYRGPAAAVKSDGTVWTWGAGNHDGELGDGTLEQHDEPVQVVW